MLGISPIQYTVALAYTKGFHTIPLSTDYPLWNEPFRKYTGIIAKDIIIIATFRYPLTKWKCRVMDPDRTIKLKAFPRIVSPPGGAAGTIGSSSFPPALGIFAHYRIERANDPIMNMPKAL